MTPRKRPRLAMLGPNIASVELRRGGASAAGASGFHRDDGLSSAARGYGADWRRVRAQRLAIEPLCRFCAAAGAVTAATDVDHIEPFAGLADPARLDLNNTRSLCRMCHMARTAAQARGGG